MYLDLNFPFCFFTEVTFVSPWHPWNNVVLFGEDHFVVRKLNRFHTRICFLKPFLVKEEEFSYTYGTHFSC